MDIAPKELKAIVAENPCSDDLNSPKWQYYKYLSRFDGNNPILPRYTRRLADFHKAV